MKKRTIISIIITFLFAILLNNFWLSSYLINIDFNISGNDNYKIEVLLNKKDNDKFNRVESEEKEFKNIVKASFDIKIKNPKRLKIVIKDAKNPITISNIELMNGKIKLDDLENFGSNAKITIKDNKILLNPEGIEDIELAYNKTLKLKAPLKFDFYILIIITVLSFLFSYKISNYIADFNSIKGKSRIDIIFLTIFFIFLFVPMMFIDKNDISKDENRKLAEYKNLISEDGNINYNFGRDFETWFNDRFGLRKALISIYKTITFVFLKQANNGIIDRKNHFLYVDYELDYIEVENFKDSFKNYFELKKWAEKNNIKLYILIVPNKNIIYTPKDYKISPFHNDFINYLNNINESNIIYPYKELIENKKNDYIFFKTEHHWTDYGAYIGYLALMKEIKKDYPNIKVLNENDYDFFYDKKIRGDFTREFSYGSAIGYLNMPSIAKKKYHKTDYRYFKHKDFDNLSIKVIDKDFHRGKIYYYPKGADLRVVQLGTSQNENLDEFLPFTFKYVKRIRNNNVRNIPENEEFKIMKYYEKEILDYKPDILIYCITYFNTLNLKDTFNKE